MENKDYLTVKEFADQIGKSRQYVYSLLDNKLKEFTSELNGHKTIDRSAINLFIVNESVNQVDSKLDSKVDNNLNTVIQILQEQLKEKDQQLKEKDEQIKELLKLNDQQQQLTLQANNLLTTSSSADQTNEEVQPKKRFSFFRK
jgi:uncharacterized phage infection (PIP) family protein YhgE